MVLSPAVPKKGRGEEGEELLSGCQDITMATLGGRERREPLISGTPHALTSPRLTQLTCIPLGRLWRPSSFVVEKRGRRLEGRERDGDDMSWKILMTDLGRFKAVLLITFTKRVPRFSLLSLVQA